MIVLALASASCVTTPPLDTHEKRLLAAEVTFNETLRTVQRNIPRMSAEQKWKARGVLTDGKQALDAARSALSLGQILDFDDRITTVNSSINILRGILEEMEKKEVSYGYSIQSTHFA